MSAIQRILAAPLATVAFAAFASPVFVHGWIDEQGGDRRHNGFLYGDMPFRLADVRAWLDGSGFSGTNMERREGNE